MAAPMCRPSPGALSPRVPASQPAMALLRPRLSLPAAHGCRPARPQSLLGLMGQAASEPSRSSTLRPDAGGGAASSSSSGPLAALGASARGRMPSVPLPTLISPCSRDSCGRSGGLLWAAAPAMTHGRNRAVSTWASCSKQQQQTVMVVESPAKAKKIQGFLGDKYTVLASYGHVRDLPSREGSVRPAEDFALDWQLTPAAVPRVAEIAGAVEGSPLLLLATDPDREGEAISWHIQQELKLRGALKRVGAVQRITFTEITRTAISAALKRGRQVSQPLVDAYLARRTLDYLVGFHLSPVLWRKLQRAKSAGRVQSVALRLVCDREAAMERFTPTPYWSITVHLNPAQQQRTSPATRLVARAPNSSPSPAGLPTTAAATAAAASGGVLVGARLTHVNGRRLGPMDINSREMAEELARRIQSGPVVVSRVTSRQLQRHPAPPFTTSSLQQEASRRLGFGAARTMRVAQQLYEGAGTGEGLISYMRTDGVQMSAEAVEELRTAIEGAYGNDVVPPQPRQYKSRAKNAQEAHEAIRPTRSTVISPATLPSSLDSDQRKLYELVFRRAMASQMTSAVYDVVTVEFSAAGGTLTLRASGSLLRQPGFLRAYADLEIQDAEEAEEEAGAELQQQQQGTSSSGSSSSMNADETSLLSYQEANGGAATEQLLALQFGSALQALPILPSQHSTRPPPRYTEASLVKALEERGIGRPSTYAPIMSLLQDRGYVSREGRYLVPTSLGRVLTAFLEHYFPKYVDYDFTSDMEEQLDDVAAGRTAWKAVLSAFWNPFNTAVAAMSNISTTQVYDMLDSALDNYFFRPVPAAIVASPIDPNGISSSGRRSSSSTSSSSTAAIDVRTRVMDSVTATAAATTAVADPRLCPKCGRGRLVIKPSRYGGFIGCSLYADPRVGCDYARPLMRMSTGGELAEGAVTSPTASNTESELAGSSEASTTSTAAAAANATERLLGSHPETGEPIWVRLGPYGLYVQLGNAVPKVPKKKSSRAPSKSGRRGRPRAAATARGKEEELDGEKAVAGDGEEEEVEINAEAATVPKRVAVPKAKGLTLQTVDLPLALGLLTLPRQLGPHPEDGLPVVASSGPFGPYVAHNGLSASLGRRAASAMDVDLATALQLLAAKRARQAAMEARGLPPGRARLRRSATPAVSTSSSPATTTASASSSVAAAARDKETIMAAPARNRRPGRSRQTEEGRGGVAKAGSGVGTASGRSRSSSSSGRARSDTAATNSQRARASSTSRPKSGYTVFLQQRWQDINVTGRGRVPFGEAVSRIAAEWRALGEEDRRRFGAAAAAEPPSPSPSLPVPAAAADGRKRSAVTSARPASPSTVRTGVPTAGLATEPPPPRSTNPYLRFAQQRRPELRATHPGATLGEISRLLGAEWAALSEAQKNSYR